MLITLAPNLENGNICYILATPTKRDKKNEIKTQIEWTFVRENILLISVHFIIEYLL